MIMRMTNKFLQNVNTRVGDEDGFSDLHLQRQPNAIFLKATKCSG
jgi:hypothetical protein